MTLSSAEKYSDVCPWRFPHPVRESHGEDILPKYWTEEDCCGKHHAKHTGITYRHTLLAAIRVYTEWLVTYETETACFS